MIPARDSDRCERLSKGLKVREGSTRTDALILRGGVDHSDTRMIRKTAIVSVLLLAVCVSVLTGCFPAVNPRASDGELGSYGEVLPERACEDFLRRHNPQMIPQALEYVGCNEGEEVGRWAAYRVRGSEAHGVEYFLSTTYAMDTLRFRCCGWELASGQRGYFKIGRHAFSVSMYSDETLQNERARWDMIPFFHVAVQVVEE